MKFISFVQYPGFSKPEQCGTDGSSAGYLFFFPNPEVVPAVDWIAEAHSLMCSSASEAGVGRIG